MSSTLTGTHLMRSPWENFPIGTPSFYGLGYRIFSKCSPKKESFSPKKEGGSWNTLIISYLRNINKIESLPQGPGHHQSVPTIFLKFFFEKFLEIFFRENFFFENFQILPNFGKMLDAFHPRPRQSHQHSSSFLGFSTLPHFFQKKSKNQKRVYSNKPKRWYTLLCSFSSTSVST